MIVFNLVDVIINAWLMNSVESVQCVPGVPAEGDGKSLDKSAHSAIDASGEKKQAQLDPGIARSGSYRASQFEQSGL